MTNSFVKFLTNFWRIFIAKFVKISQSSSKFVTVRQDFVKIRRDHGERLRLKLFIYFKPIQDSDACSKLFCQISFEFRVFQRIELWIRIFSSNWSRNSRSFWYLNSDFKDFRILNSEFAASQTTAKQMPVFGIFSVLPWCLSVLASSVISEKRTAFPCTHSASRAFGHDTRTASWAAPSTMCSWLSNTGQFRARTNFV